MKRGLLLAAAPFAATAQARAILGAERLGAYAGEVRFYRSIPLADSEHPHDDEDDTPFGVTFSISAENGGLSVWLRVDGGPMQTTTGGEMLTFGPIEAGFAKLVSSRAKPAPKSATLTAQPDSLGTEALFTFADGSFWRRHFNARFRSTGADLIFWVFDAQGTRARTWRGRAMRLPARPQDGRAPT